MKVWEWSTTNKNDYLVTSQESVENYILETYKFDGERIVNKWVPIDVEVYQRGKEKKLGPYKTDAPIFNTGQVLSRNAINQLSDLLEDNAEVLPLNCNIGEYYLLNVINSLDCIDYDKAEYIPLASSGKPMVFTKYSFKKDTIGGKHLFKIIGFYRTVFVSNEFKERVLNQGLTGFFFKLAWDSELEG